MLQKLMPAPPTYSSLDRFPDWTSMEAHLYQLDPGESETPPIPDLQIVMQLSVDSLNIDFSSEDAAVGSPCLQETVIVIPAHRRAVWQWKKHVEFIQLKLTLDFLLSLEAGGCLDAEKLVSIEKYNFYDPIIAQVAHLIERMLRIKTMNAGIHYLDSIATFLALHLAHNGNSTVRSESDGQNSHVSDLERAIEFIRTNLDKELRLEQLAKVMNLSDFYCLKLFKSAYGKTPHQYILDCRIALARQLLVETMLPISEISQRCGFSTQSHFANAFHRNTGFAPRQFRQLGLE